MDDRYNVTEFNNEECELIFKFQRLISQTCIKTKSHLNCHFCKFDFICNTENIEHDIENFFF